VVLYEQQWQFNKLPERQEHVKIMEKRIEYNMEGTAEYIVVFRFPEIYDDIHENETGTLTYKENKKGKSYIDRKFISFEKDLFNA